jgi:hypothetical protein
MQEENLSTRQVPAFWMQAIKDARLQIEAHKRQIKALEAAIRTFKQNAENKEPVPIKKP